MALIHDQNVVVPAHDLGRSDHHLPGQSVAGVPEDYLQGPAEGGHRNDETDLQCPMLLDVVGQFFHHDRVAGFHLVSRIELLFIGTQVRKREHHVDREHGLARSRRTVYDRGTMGAGDEFLQQIGQYV